MFTPTTIAQRVRIAVHLLHAQSAGRHVTRPQLHAYLGDLAAAEVDAALEALQAEGVVHALESGFVPRPPPDSLPQPWTGALTGRPAAGPRAP